MGAFAPTSDPEPAAARCGSWRRDELLPRAPGTNRQSSLAPQRADDGHGLVVLDDLSTGHETRCPPPPSIRRGTLRTAPVPCRHRHRRVLQLRRQVAGVLVGRSSGPVTGEQPRPHAAALLEAMLHRTRRIVSPRPRLSTASRSTSRSTETCPFRPTIPTGPRRSPWHGPGRLRQDAPGSARQPCATSNNVARATPTPRAPGADSAPGYPHPLEFSHHPYRGPLTGRAF